MTYQRNSYTAYGIGCAVVWAVLLGVSSVSAPAAKRRDIRVVAAGWWLGWLSATIARAVYPPTEAQRRAATS